MGFAESFVMALALSVDALVCAILYSKCAATPGGRFKLAATLGLFFGFFQFLMPVIGFFAGAAAVAYIGSFDHYLAFALLAYVSFKMFKDAFSTEEEDPNLCRRVSYLTIFILSIATSIDALALGVSVGLISNAILFFASIVGITCFIVSFMGGILGQVLAQFKSLDKTLNILGALVLFGIGCRVLVEHGVFDFVLA